MNIALSSILLFALTIPYIMTVRLSWEDTPFWLFGMIFLLLLLNVIFDTFYAKKKYYFRIKYFVVWSLIILVLGSTFISAIVVRHRVAPIYNVHDIILQQESAIRFFLDGKNPYAVTYFGTPLEDWHYSDTETNPALYHFVMQPWYLLFSLPFYFVSFHTIGYFDGRIPLFLLFFLALIITFKIVKDSEKKILSIALLAFNPAIILYTLEGRSDMFMHGFLVTGLFFLWWKRYFRSAIILALAFAVKQSVWLLFPFYAAYLYFETKNWKRTAIYLLPFFVTLSLVTGPFFIWDAKAFLNSTVFYLSGTVEHSYPISGYGLGMMLHQFGIIKNVKDYYPFIIWQTLFCIPMLYFFIQYLKKHTTVKTMILMYGIFLCVYWYLSRYFNNSHLGYLSVVFITAYFWPTESPQRNEK